MPKSRLTPFAVLAALACTTAAWSDPPTLQARLDRVIEQLEEARQSTNTPGMSFALIKDDHVILAQGFGLADVDAKTPATDETLFAIGSTSKAFTAALVGMLVDDGKMQWDDPVRTHLPIFQLADPAANEQAAFRDLLSHRVGLASMTLLWYGNDAVTREDIIRTAAKAELLYPFRERFSYSNISYLAAGMAAGAAEGTDWDTLLGRRILTPLGMGNSNTTYSAAQADSRMAKGYRWERDDEQLSPHPMRRVDMVGPAGSINSSARDMAQWVRFQLGRGTYEGVQLLSPEQHEQTWTRHINVQGNVDYGLGWFLREWNGKRVIEHAGGIDGFTAEVAMIPEENLGFVLLMNLFACPLQEQSREIVFAAMLEDWVDDDAVAAEDFGPYLGTYIANFGQFNDAEFQVLEQNGQLAVDVPGQQVFELAPPDDEGHRQFTLTDQIKVQFNRSDGGNVYSFTIFQSGYTFEVPRQGAEMPVEIDLSAALRYLGQYHSEGLNVNVSLLIQNNRLAIDVPGQAVVELHAPDDEGRRLFRIRDSLWVRINQDEAGEAVSLTFSEEGNLSELPRVAAAEDADALPSVEEVMAMVHTACGAEHLKSLKNFKASGTIRMVHLGIEGTISTFVENGGGFRDHIDLGQFGHIRLKVEGDTGWIDMPILPDTDLDGEFLEQASLQHPLLWLGDWRKTFTDIHVREKREHDGEPVYVVSLKPPLGRPHILMVSVETGLPVAREISSLTLLGTRIPTEYTFDEYHEVMGVMIPHRYETRTPINGRSVARFETFAPNVETDEHVHGCNPGPCPYPGRCCPPTAIRLVRTALAVARAVW